MKIILTLVLTLFFVTPITASADDEKEARYQIITIQSLTGKTEPFLLDTTTGRVWIYASVKGNDGTAQGSGWVPTIFYPRVTEGGVETLPREPIKSKK